MYLQKNISTNNGYHKTFKIRFKLNFIHKSNYFNYKNSVRRNKLINNQNNLRSLVNYKVKFSRVNSFNYSNLKPLLFSINLFLNKLNNKVFILVVSSNGMFCYLLMTANMELFSYFLNFKVKYRVPKTILKVVMPIFKLKRKARISLFSLFFENKTIYCKASGAYATIISVYKNNKQVLINLPSSKKLLINHWNIAFVGKVKRFYKKKLINTKAGFLRFRGKSSITRGVCMNPIDHPHGGNTKSIKFHRTPWGLATKKK